MGNDEWLKVEVDGGSSVVRWRSIHKNRITIEITDNALKKFFRQKRRVIAESSRSQSNLIKSFV